MSIQISKQRLKGELQHRQAEALAAQDQAWLQYNANIFNDLYEQRISDHYDDPRD